MRAAGIAWLASVILASLAGGAVLAGVQTSDQPSDVVLVFDVSNSILRSTDGTNVEFAEALEGIADRVEQVAADLEFGNAKVSFVAFGRQAIPYPANCAALDLHENSLAIARFETCLRRIASEYRAGADAPVTRQINTVNTDHVAALTEAASLLPATSSRSAVIFFTDGEHDPPGTARDNEDVIARVIPAFEGISPLAILPVGLGAGAGAFEDELTAIYAAFLRDMQPCAGRTDFAWPEVIFDSADQAGTAVALALQEVTCSFTVAPTVPPVTPSPEPTAPPLPIGVPTGIRVLGGDRSLTVQFTPPATNAEGIDGYVVRCTPEGGGAPIEAAVDAATELEAEFSDLAPGVGYQCSVVATAGDRTGDPSAISEPVVVLGIPLAPSQPRAEPLDNAARISVDAPTGGIPVEQYGIECTGAGGTVAATGSGTSMVVNGLTNGQSFDCVAYAENRIGKSPASAAVSVTPCGGIFSCNPLLAAGIGGGALLALLAVGFFAYRQLQRRNRVWVTAQVDGGENLPLGWGPDLGVRLEQGEGGWFASAGTYEASPIKVKYEGKNRFLVTSGTRITDVHQGDPAPVRASDGAQHQLILRRYRDRPNEKRVVAAPKDAPTPEKLGARIEGREAAAAAAEAEAAAEAQAEAAEIAAASEVAQIVAGNEAADRREPTEPA